MERALKIYVTLQTQVMFRYVSERKKKIGSNIAVVAIITSVLYLCVNLHVIADICTR